MRQIGVHRHEPAIAVLEAAPESLAVRASQPEASAALEDVHAAQPFAERTRGVRRAVGGAVVDDQDVGGRDVKAELFEELREVLALVVGRDDDERFAPIHRSGSSSGVITSSSAMSHVPPQNTSSGLTRRT